MHPRLVAGSWVGFNDGRVTISSSHRGAGARTALPIVGDFYRRTLHTRLIDSGARFATPPDSFFGSLLGKVHGLFDRTKPEPEPSRSQPRQSPPPRMPMPDVEPDMRLNELDRITDQASEAEQSYEDEHNSEDAPGDQVKAVGEGGQGIIDIPHVEESVGAPAN
jgi:penicillin-binding protein 1A